MKDKQIVYGLETIKNGFISCVLFVLCFSFIVEFCFPNDVFALTKPVQTSPGINSEISTTSATFSWSHPYNDQYELKIKTESGTLKYASGKISSKSISVDLSQIPLSYGSTYKWYVVVYANGTEDSSEDRWFTFRPSGRCSVSGLNILSNPVVLGQNFNISVSLKETKGFPKTFENIAIAIIGPNGNFLFDFTIFSNVSIGAAGTWSKTANNVIHTSNPAGTYKVEIRGKVGGQWFLFDTTGSGVNPKSFTVSQTGGVSGILHQNSVSGTNLSGATVTCGGKSTTTASDGKYTITGISTGTKPLLFSKTGYQSFSKSITISAGQTLNAGHNYLIVTPTTGSVRGRLHIGSSTGAVLSGASVNCGGKVAKTVSDGTYLISNIGVGSRLLIFSKTGYQSYSKSVTISAGQTFNAGENYLTVTPTRGSVRGRLHANSATGAVIAGATVTCGGKSTTTASDGTYAIYNILTGQQTLAFSKVGYLNYSRNITIAAGVTLFAGENYLLSSNNNKFTWPVDPYNTTDGLKTSLAECKGATLRCFYIIDPMINKSQVWYDAQGFQRYYWTGHGWHLGADYNRSTNEVNVYAVATGNISQVIENLKGWGNVIFLKHETSFGTYTTMYAHVKWLNGKHPIIGSTYKRGAKIAEVGNGEWSSAKPTYRYDSGIWKSVGYPSTNGKWNNHLHFEIRRGTLIDTGPGYTKCDNTSDSKENTCPQKQVDPNLFISNHN